MRTLACIGLLLLAPACTRDVDLGREGPGSTGTTASGGCFTSSECGMDALCVNGACVSPAQACAPQSACAASTGPVCAASCPACGGAPPCCTDDGFGACVCFCGQSCAGPPCAPAGTDPGPVASPSCTSDASCLCGERCQAQSCTGVEQRVVCRSSFDCESAGCTPGSSCIGGACVPPGWRCQNVRECGGAAAGFSCQQGTCVCVDHSPQSCTGDGDCTACTGKLCRGGQCQVPFSTTGGATGSAGTGTTGAASSGSSAGSGSTGGSGSSSGSVGSGSGSGSLSGSTGL